MSTGILILLMFLLGFAPGIFWLWFFYKRDKIEPEPKGLVIKVFLLGIAIAVPVVVIQIPIMALPAGILAVIFAPLIEEFAKYFAVKKTVYTFKEFDEPMDGIIYAAAIALGFASIENVGYLYSAFTEVDGGRWGVFALRALLSVPGHVLFSGMWGYALGMAKFSDVDEKAKKKMIRRGLLLSMLLHAGFNLCATLAPVGAIGMIILVPIFWILLHKKIKKALRISPHLKVMDTSSFLNLKPKDKIEEEDIEVDVDK